jgi:hypothetical protein
MKFPLQCQPAAIAPGEDAVDPAEIEAIPVAQEQPTRKKIPPLLTRDWELS